MKKFLIIILISIFSIIPVNAANDIEIENIKYIKSSDGVISNDKENVNVVFNDLNQTINYEAVIKNNTNQKLYVNSLESENSKEKFIEYKLDSKSENMVLEPNSSAKILFQIKTLEIEGAGRNLDEQIKVNFLLSDKLTNPNTFSNIIDLIILLSVLVITIYFVMKNKKVKTLILIVGISVVGIYYVEANDYIKSEIDCNIKYQSQNNIISTGTTLNDKQADYTNAKEVWAYYDKVKNVEVKSLINEPKEYYKKFDLTENKTGRVMAYLVENNDKDTPYDLKIMSKGVVIANKDSSFMFSFPNTEKVEGLTNVDFTSTESMQGMFIGNEKIKQLEVDAIELSNTVDTSYMFYDCEKIVHDESDFNLENVTNTTNMFTPYLYDKLSKKTVSDINVDFSKKAQVDGNYVVNETISNENPIYYFRGNVQNNNVILGNYCWKMVRTTDTKGIKMIYNGTKLADGSCNNTGTASQIGTSQFNTWEGELGEVSYMFNKTGDVLHAMGGAATQKVLYNKKMNDNLNYYYSKEVKYENGLYVLQNPEQKLWKTYKTDNQLIGYYTCVSPTETSCSKVSYIVFINGNTLYSSEVLNGKTIENDTIILGKNYKLNSDNTYTLTDTEKVKKVDWYKDYKKYKEYYSCKDYHYETCNELYYAPSVNYYYLYVTPVTGTYKIAKSFVYEDGVYKLVNPKVVNKGYYFAKDEFSKEHTYVCPDPSATECETLNYIYLYSGTYAYYYNLSNGDDIYDLERTQYENKTSSKIKKMIDNWYSQNMINYANYLEDTTYCNDKSRYEKIIKEDKKMSAIAYSGYERFSISLESINPIINCKNKNDNYSVDSKNGNGALTYPIGLLSADEIVFAGMNFTEEAETYLNTGKTWWTMTPLRLHGDYQSMISASSSGRVSTSVTDSAIGVRPVISIKAKTKYTTGDGTKENPYVIEGIEQ